MSQLAVEPYACSDTAAAPVASVAGGGIVFRPSDRVTAALTRPGRPGNPGTLMPGGRVAGHAARLPGVPQSVRHHKTMAPPGR